MEKHVERAPSGQATQASPRARKRSLPFGECPSRKDVWNLICITRKGKVSMLRDLDLYTARETYKRLRPESYPVSYKFPDCEKCAGGGWCWSTSSGFYSSDDDGLDRVEIVGPPGENLDPWHGVEPRIRDMTHLCRCPKPETFEWPATDFERRAMTEAAKEETP